MAPGGTFDDSKRVQVLRYAVDAFNAESADVRLGLAVFNITRGGELAALRAAYANGSGPSYYVGPTTSAGLASVMGYADKRGIVLVSPSSNAAQLAVANDTTFRLTIGIDREAAALARVMSDASIGAAVTIVRDDAWGQSFNSSLGEALAGHGIKVHRSIPFADRGTDWPAVARAAGAAAASLPPEPRAGVVFAGFGTNYDSMASAAAAQGGAAAAVPWFVPSAAVGASTLAPIGNEAARNFSASVGLTALGHNVLPSPATGRIDANLSSPAGGLSYYEYATYDSVFVLGAAIRTALAADQGGQDGARPDPAGVKAAMPSAALAHNGALGRIALNSKGDLLTPDAFGVWRVDPSGGWARAEAAVGTPVVNIGMLAILAGGHEDNRVAAARLAVNDYNWEREASPGGASHHLYLDVYNITVDNSPPRALDALRAAQAAAGGTHYFVGPSTSGNTKRVLEHANSNGIVLVSPSATAPSLSIAGDNLFRLAPDDSQQGLILASVIDRDLESAAAAALPAGPAGAAAQANKTVIVVARDDAWGRDLNRTAVERLGMLGVRALPMSFPESADWNAVASRLNPAIASLHGSGGGGAAAAAAAAVLFIGLAPDFRAIAPLADDSLPWYGPDSIAASRDVAGDEAARAFAEAVNMTATLFDAGSNAVQDDIGARLAAVGATGLRVYDYSTYDSVRILADAIAMALAQNASAGAPGVKGEMHAAAASYAGALGDVALNSRGDLRTPNAYALWAVEGGAWKRAESFPGTPVVGIGAIVSLHGSPAADSARLEAMRLAAEEYNTASEAAAGPMYIDLIETRISLVPGAARGGGGALPPALEALRAAYANGSGPSYYVGPSTSGNAGRVLDFANRNNITLISPSSTAPSLAVAGDSLFRLAPNDARQGVVIADIVHNQQGAILAGLINGSGAEHVVAVVRNDSWGRGLDASTAARFEAHNITATRIVHPEHAANWTAVAARLNSTIASLRGGAAAVAVLHIGFQGDFAALAAQSASHGELAAVPWYGTDGIAGARSIVENPAALGLADAVNLTATIFDVEGNARTRAVADALAGRGVASPGAYTYAAYDAVLVMAGAVEMAAAGDPSYGPADVRGMVRAAAAEYEGALGDIALNAAGDLRTPNGYATWTVDGGAWKRAGAHPPTPVFEIGALLELGGDPSRADGPEKAAMELAADDFNAAHELVGDFYIDLAVQRISASPGSASPDPGALAGLRAIHDGGRGPAAYVGLSSSASAESVLDYADASGLVMISHSASAPSLAVPGDSLFRLVPDHRRLVPVLARVLAEGGATDLVVAERGDARGPGVGASLSDALGGQARIARVPLAGAGANWTDAAGDLAAAVRGAAGAASERGAGGAAAVVFAGLDGDFVELASRAGAEDAAALGSVEWFGSGGIGTSRLVLDSPAALGLAKSTNLTAVRFTAEPNDANRRLDPGAAYGPSAYDSVLVMGSAMKAAHAREGAGMQPPSAAGIRAALPAAARGYTGALGDIVLDANGDLLAPVAYGTYAIGAGNEWNLGRIHGAHAAPPPGGDARCGGEGRVVIGELYAAELAGQADEVHAAYGLAVADFNRAQAQANGSRAPCIELQRAEISLASPAAGLRAAYANGTGPSAYLGPITSAAAEALAPFADANGIVLVSPTSQSTSPRLARPDGLFRLSLNDGYEADLVAIAASEEGIGTVIPVLRNDSYGLSYGAEFAREAGLLGMDVLDPVVVPAAAAAGGGMAAAAHEINRRVAALGAAGGGLSATALFVAASNADLRGLAGEAAGYPLLSSVKWFEPGNLHAPLPLSDPETLRLAQGAQLHTTSWEVPQTDGLRRIHDALSLRIGSEPHQFAYAAYDAVFMLAGAINASMGDGGGAPSYDGAGVAAAMQGAAGRLDGLLGSGVALDANGDRYLPNRVIVWKSQPGTGAWSEAGRVQLPDTCGIALARQSVSFGDVRAGEPSQAAAQTITNAGSMPFASVSVTATPWTAEATRQDAVLGAGATEVMGPLAGGGISGWTPLSGGVTVGGGLEPAETADIRFRLNAPAGAYQGGQISQTVTYAASCR